MQSRSTAGRVWLFALALACAIVAAYGPAVRGDFLWDDDLHITANPTIVGPLGLTEIWTTSRANYFPLVLTNFWLQHAAWGLNPLGYHIVTLAFHVIAALLLWRVLVRLHVPGAWLGAAMWALHPVQTESVAWICELKNTQSAGFFLAAVLFWIRWIDVAADVRRLKNRQPSLVTSAATPKRLLYCLALGCALLAILSKPSTVMLPMALALATWWQRRRFTLRDLIPLIPFFTLSALAAGWAIWEQKFHSGAVGPEWAQTWPERGIIAGRALWFYLSKLAWPADLSFIYPRWNVDATRLLMFGPLLFALAILAWLVWRRARVAGGFLAAMYFAALLFPVLGFFDVYFFRYSFVGDHFQYLASIGPLTLLAAAVSVVFPRRSIIAGGAIVTALALLTAAQCADYRSRETLWRATVKRNPDSAMPWAQLGAVHVDAGRHDEAVACFQHALRLNPRHPEALNHLGCEYLRVGKTDDAIVELQRAIEARPGFAEAHNNLALALVRADRGREALAYFQQSIRLQPERAQTHDDYGLALAAAGRADEAITAYQRALALQPGLASAYNNLGVTLAKLGRLAEALAQFNEAVRFDPAYAAAHLNRGGALTALERLPEACDAFTRAVQLQPDSAKAHAYLAQLLQALGRTDEARVHFERAQQLDR